MQKKWIFFVGLLLCLFLAWMYNQYQKPRAGVAAEDPEYKLTAQQLYKAFAADEAAATKKYTGQVVQVQGVVADIQKADEGLSVLLAGDNDVGGVNCSFVKMQRTAPALGERVTVKGRCTGFLMDVNLVDAVLVNN